MAESEDNKRTIRDFIQTVWIGGDLAALPNFWTAACVNHATPGGSGVGLEALRAYHEGFFTAFTAFADVRVEILQQVAEGDRVVTHLTSRGTHTGEFGGVLPTGRSVSLSTIRIDRLQGGKIAEHWSVADVAGLLQQIQG